MASTDPFLGYLVSIETKKNVFYQGVVQNISSKKDLIWLKNCFQNGFQCGDKVIEIKTQDIENLEILADAHNAQDFLKAKPQKQQRCSSSPSTSSSTSSSSSSLYNEDSNTSSGQKKKDKTAAVVTGTTVTSKRINESTTSTSSNDSRVVVSNSRTTTKILTAAELESQGGRNNKHQRNHQHHHRHHHRHQQREQQASEDKKVIGAVNVNALQDDFDFEKNLAMFDKQAFYDEMVGTSSLSESETGAHPPPRPKQQQQTESSLSMLEKFMRADQDKRLAKKFDNSITLTSQTAAAINNSQQQRYYPISVANLFGLSTSSSSNALSSTEKSSSLTPASSAPETTVQTNVAAAAANGAGNYRYDENVLATGDPVSMQQIELPPNHKSSSSQQIYVTDDGYIVPCLDGELRRRLYDECVRVGFTHDHLVAAMARSCAEMCIQLLGGPIRFSPKNSHQRPSVLVLANSGALQGAYALATARLLSLRGVKIYLFVHEAAKLHETFRAELGLLKANVTGVAGEPGALVELATVEQLAALPTAVVDLIVNGLDTHASSSLLSGHAWYRALVKHLVGLSSKTSVLAIDPPAEGSAIPAKWCVVPVLPQAMSRNCGRVFLADLGVTRKCFQAVGIKYQSPFGAKFLIPLHTD